MSFDRWRPNPGSILETFLQGPGLIPLTESAYSRLPVAAWTDELVEIAPYLRDYFSHVEDPQYWRDLSICTRFASIQTPMYHVGSWYDIFLEGTLSNFVGIQEEGAAGARDREKMLLGPWVHRPLSDPYTRPSSTAGEADFGRSASVELLSELLRWFRFWLDGEANGIADEPAVSVFVMGANRWRSAETWPRHEVTYQRLYLRSDGRLSWKPPGDEPPDTYVYDPDSPTPTRGGSTIALESGARDQRPVESRPDVLVYTSDTLGEPIEITGPLSAVLYAASSCVDTDFVVRLVDVSPDGYSRNIQDGVISASS